ncbi:thermonuclease family protein [Croceicoccus sp. F390]|uniref:Thermonuclease family protein n=1 Tax=Croceicoccus esteveae TaxID=3075597 RepID=A0ABU2ZHI0_9SPHN|nr:thermonuclease family protein [Croceicoccus sp. F390]MDT0575054.1 thermonuclease family protein [Croceicoccus sp. F390]
MKMVGRKRYRGAPPLQFWPKAKRKSRMPGGALTLIIMSLCLIMAGILLRQDVTIGDITIGAPSATTGQLGIPPASAADTLSARFVMCDGPARDNCVVDGDTFWFAGDKIRIADLNTPETSSPDCDAELVLGTKATDRLRELLNAGPFSLVAADRDEDRYGRKLRTVERGGQSLSEILIREGLGESWKGYRSGWC